jgi:hypothetical protein
MQLYTFFPGGNIIYTNKSLCLRAQAFVWFLAGNFCTLSEQFVKYYLQYAQYIDTGN